MYVYGVVGSLSALATHAACPQVILAVAVKKQTLPLHPEWPRKLTRLLSACLSHDPSLRPSFLELMQLLAVVRQELQELGLLHTVPQRFDDVEVRPLLTCLHTTISLAVSLYRTVPARCPRRLLVPSCRYRKGSFGPSLCPIQGG